MSVCAKFQLSSSSRSAWKVSVVVGGGWLGWGLQSHFHVQPNNCVEVVLRCVVVGVVTTKVCKSYTNAYKSQTLWMDGKGGEWQILDSYSFIWTKHSRAMIFIQHNSGAIQLDHNFEEFLKRVFKYYISTFPSHFIFSNKFLFNTRKSIWDIWPPLEEIGACFIKNKNAKLSISARIKDLKEH